MLRRIRLFADSNSDFLDEKWPIETLAALLKEIHDAPNVDVQLLTKRPENFVGRMQAVQRTGDREDGLSASGTVTDFGHNVAHDWLRGVPPSNIWLGVSVENQAMADKRIPELLKIPAAVRFLSIEPLLSSVDLSKWLYDISRVGIYGANDIGMVCDKTGRNNMEDDGFSRGRSIVSSKDKTKACGCQSVEKGRVQASNVSSQWKTPKSSSASNCVDGLQFDTNTGSDGNKSQGRSEGQQSSIQSGSPNSQEQCASLVSGVASKEKITIRGNERRSKNYQDASGGNQNHLQGASDATEISGETIRTNSKRNISNSKRKELGISWIICGGESGPNRRDCGVEAIVSVAYQGKAAGVPVYVKQDCAFKSGQQGRIPDEIWRMKQFLK